MHGKLEDWNNGCFGIQLLLRSTEIDQLIEILELLKTDPDQHFHISSDYVAAGGIGDIEVSINQLEEMDNLRIGGKALGPGSEIDI